MAAKITKSTVDQLLVDQRKNPTKDLFLWDNTRKGFGVKCTPAGKRVYVVQYRLHGGRDAKVRRYTIGPHGTWTPETAGKEAERLLRLVGQGIDPAAERERSRTEAQELAFSTYADKFLEQFVKAKWARSYSFAESALRLHAKPAFGNTPLPEIDARRLTRFYDGLPSDQPGLRRNVHAVLRRLMRWAKGRGDITADPFEGFEAPPAVESRDRVLEPDELKVLWAATADLTAPYDAFVRLLMLTGQRRNEVAGMDWKELHRAEAVWLIPSDRAKNGVEHLLPMSPQVIAELDLLAGGETWPKRGLALTATGKTPLSAFSKTKRALDAAMLKAMQADDNDAELDPWRFHDLRRSMATHMQKLRISSDIIEACENRLAGRSKAGSAKVYQRHDYADEKREAMEKWGAFLAGLFADKSNVVLLAKAG